MKIEIHLDIESIVREALRNNELTDNIIVNAKANNVKNTPKGIVWEYGRKNGRRRTIEEIALHALEKKYGRLLTPEEKGEAKAIIHIDETTENTVKEAAIKKDRIDKIAAEGMAAASKELAEEAQNTKGVEVKDGKIMDSAASDEAKIPKTEDLGGLNSLFS